MTSSVLHLHTELLRVGVGAVDGRCATLFTTSPQKIRPQTSPNLHTPDLRPAQQDGRLASLRCVRKISVDVIGKTDRSANHTHRTSSMAHHVGLRSGEPHEFLAFEAAERLSRLARVGPSTNRKCYVRWLNWERHAIRRFGVTCLRVVYRRLLLRSLTCTSGSLLAPTSYYYAYWEWRLAAGMSGRSRELRF